MKVPSISSKRAGFTLIELLLTLSIFGAMMVLVSSSFFQFHDQNHRVQEEISLRQEMRALERLLRTDLSHAVYLSRFMKNGSEDNRKSGIVSESIPVANGFEDRLYLHVRGKSVFFRGNLQEQDPYLHEVGYIPKFGDDGKLHLIRREQFYIDTDITSGDGVQHSLTDKLVSFQLQFLDESSEGYVKSWIAKIGSPMPDAVKVTLKLQGGKGNDLTSSFTVNIRPVLGRNIRWEAP